MRKLLLLILIHKLLTPVQSVNGVIWNKRIGEFVPIFSVPAYEAMNQELLNQSRGQETHNFRGRVVKMTYFEMHNIIVGKANGTMVTGIMGEIWNTLSEFLNFTLKPISTNEHTLGHMNKNNSYSFGLLRSIQQNETDVIPRVEAHNKRLQVAQLTIPLWMASCRLYIRPEVRHVPTWMLRLFSKRVWYAILLMYLLLSVCSYLSQTIDSKISRKRAKARFYDHIFYNFGMICGQSYLPVGFSKSSRVVELWLGLFSLLVRTAFGALLIGYMTQTVTAPPFHDLNSLLDNTKYKIVALNGSLASLIFQISNETDLVRVHQMNRVVNLNSVEEMYKLACSSKGQHAIFESDDIKKANGMYFCQLNPTRFRVAHMWIVSAISRNFSYKRSIDIGILKLYEVGFIKLMKQRWIESKNVEAHKSSATDPIIMEQVYLILYVYFCGLLISFVILIAEKVTYYYKN